MRTITRTVVTLAAAATVALAPLGVANAATPAGPPPAPTACAPENVRTTVTPGVSPGEYTSYTFRMTAAPGTAPCALNGWPHPVTASHQGVPVEVPYAGPADGSASPVEFGPGSPVAFDVRVEQSAEPLVAADTVEFTASSTLEQIPGRFVATGDFAVGENMSVTAVYASR
ncbi:hypothetical protein [Pseudonocardia sp. HH130630-07]|uniref:hypothetical protein n=1 Tax=Pseudonocardia sp. HH130630-07 TaxID=1690815 RepID=UPI0008151F94|nr:hypothetical protein [Pseudonocardia sp. HH130630-07]ANY06027.1 hypothetical protein AFB00_06585 [Pseudonocardia sp. HH130630-07]